MYFDFLRVCEMYGKNNMETYITICKIDSQQEFRPRNSNSSSVSTWMGGMGREMRAIFKRKEIYVYLWLIHVEV